MFLWNYLVFSMIQRMLAIGPLVPLPFLNPAYIFGNSWITNCWSLVWRILSITLLACEVSATEQQFENSLVLPFFGIGMKTDNSNSHSWEVISYCDFGLHFPDGLWQCAYFHVPVGICLSSLKKISIQGIYPFFSWVVWLTDVEFLCVLCLFWILIPY